MRARIALAATLLAPALAWAAPGPDSTAVLANSAVPESVALGARYAAARAVPDRQVCNLNLPTDVDMTLDDFRTKLLQPLFACLDEGGVTARIEAVVIMRGVPLRVVIPTPKHGDQSVSLAAALMTWKSTLSAGGDFLGSDPGDNYPGNGIYGGIWSNVYNGATTTPFAGRPFKAGWSATGQGVEWKPVLVTMLHGRSYDDAGKLIDSALGGEKNGGAKADFVLMDGADGARGALDYQYAIIQPALEARGMTVKHVPFNSDLTGLSIAALAVGTAGMGQTIEGNTYLPGSIVDNLTSYGAVPQNFETTGEAQVSIARWVAMGVAGAHGTTEEPINNAFPTRTFLLHYVDGFTLAESYLMEMPFFYWRNLVLGDPMAAPYAVRPQVKVTVGDCLQKQGTRHVAVGTFDTERIGVGSVTLYMDGVSVGGGSSAIVTDLTLPKSMVQLLAVAQKRDDGSLRGKALAKGWDEVRLDGSVPVDACAMGGSGGSGGEGGLGGAGGSGGSGQGGTPTIGTTTPKPHGGCSAAGGGSLAALLLGAALLRRRR